MPEGSTTETPACHGICAKLGHKQRADRLLEEKSLAFGFNKDDKEESNEA